jgi:preprotein translocase subunit SecG
MKKIFITLLLFSAAFGAHAQSNTGLMSDRATFEEFVRNIVILLMIFMVTSFILTMIRLILDNGLKKKMVEMGTPESVVSQLMATGKNEARNSLKWFCALCGIAAGLGIIGCYHLSDIYALMVIAFCLAVGFLGHFLLASRLNK